jgi:molybdopterin synthase catalytic subunit/molybdopterin converting factor small subunit
VNLINNPTSNDFTVSEENRNETSQIVVRVLFFGAARDAVGEAEITFSLSHPVNVALAFEQVLDAFPALRRFGRSLLFAVNEEYARPEREVFAGDELAVFPSVSGGAQPDRETRGHGDGETGRRGDTERQDDGNTGTAAALPTSTVDTTLADKDRNDFFELTAEPLDVGAVARRVVLPECGATVTLDGYAREWTKGKRTLRLLYEAYPSMALREMRRLGQEAHDRFDIAHIGIVHRTGRLEIGETSVVIAVSAPHRRAAFEACEWAIRELKRTVPIWKKEVFEDGSVWVEGEATRTEG